MRSSLISSDSSYRLAGRGRFTVVGRPLGSSHVIFLPEMSGWIHGPLVPNIGSLTESAFGGCIGLPHACRKCRNRFTKKGRRCMGGSPLGLALSSKPQRRSAAGARSVISHLISRLSRSRPLSAQKPQRRSAAVAHRSSRFSVSHTSQTIASERLYDTPPHSHTPRTMLVRTQCHTKSHEKAPAEKARGEEVHGRIPFRALDSKHETAKAESQSRRDESAYFSGANTRRARRARQLGGLGLVLVRLVHSRLALLGLGGVGAPGLGRGRLRLLDRTRRLVLGLLLLGRLGRLGRPLGGGVLLLLLGLLVLGQGGLGLGGLGLLLVARLG